MVSHGALAQSSSLHYDTDMATIVLFMLDVAVSMVLGISTDIARLKKAHQLQEQHTDEQKQ